MVPKRGPFCYDRSKVGPTYRSSPHSSSHPLFVTERYHAITSARVTPTHSANVIMRGHIANATVVAILAVSSLLYASNFLNWNLRQALWDGRAVHVAVKHHARWTLHARAGRPIGNVTRSFVWDVPVIQRMTTDPVKICNFSSKISKWVLISIMHDCILTVLYIEPRSSLFSTRLGYLYVTRGTKGWFDMW